MNGIHFLLTYACNFECDHCFLYCGPKSEGTFTIKQIRDVLEEAKKIKTIEWIFFEGGEPFLYYPILLEGLRCARDMGFKTGIVTNTYWSTSLEDAELWIKPIEEIGISNVSFSDDSFHFENSLINPAKIASEAAKKLGLPDQSICIEKPTIKESFNNNKEKGEPVIGGGPMFRGRAVEKLIEGLPTRPWDEFKSCPHEDLQEPRRVHIDSYGNVHICQGINMGNMWETTLSKLVNDYDPENHPICGPLIRGGPAQLAREYGIKPQNNYVDECHFCYVIRKKLIDKYPQYLAPKQVYGL